MNAMLEVEARKCMGCYACEVACKEAHVIPPDQGSLIRISRADATRAEAEVRGHYRTLVCVHCVEPPCVEVCPEGAITRRDDGIVLLDSGNCTGCRSCAEVCPYDAIFFDEEGGVAIKCDLCAERMEAGLWPSCVKHCFAQVFFLEPSG
jgi:Fe-S-cluster-containing dehydrogenase component